MDKNRQHFLTIAAAIDGNTFIRFALFDTFRLKSRWKAPAMFAFVMTVLSVVCFSVKDTHEQAPLLGTVLLAVGLLFPSVWFLMFMVSVRSQVKKNALSARKAQYYVLLIFDGVKVTKGSDEVEFSWSDISMAYRVKGCIYLYINEQRAYLLPKCDDSDEAWEIITGSIPESRAKDLR